MRNSMEYEHPERRAEEGERPRVTRSKFEALVERGATHMAMGLMRINQSPDAFEANVALLPADYASQIRRGEVPVDTFEPSEEERDEFERLRSRIATTLSVVLVRRFEITSEPNLFDVHDVISQ